MTADGTAIGRRVHGHTSGPGEAGGRRAVAAQSRPLGVDSEVADHAEEPNTSTSTPSPREVSWGLRTPAHHAVALRICETLVVVDTPRYAASVSELFIEPPAPTATVVPSSVSVARRVQT